MLNICHDGSESELTTPAILNRLRNVLSAKKGKSYRNLKKKTRRDGIAGRSYVVPENVLQTNDTNDAEEDYVMVDSGFSGEAVVGEEWLQRNAHKFKAVKKLGKRSRATYTFGAGVPIRPVDSARITHSRFGNIRVDVVPGKLPFLVGRRLLRAKGVKLDFEKDVLEINGKKSKSAHKIVLSSLDDGEPARKHSGTLDCGAKEVACNQNPGKADGSASSTGTAQLDQSQSYRGKGGESGPGRLTCVGRDCLCDLTVEEISTVEMGKRNVKPKKTYVAANHDRASMDFNVYSALSELKETYPEREVEEAIIRGWTTAPLKDAVERTRPVEITGDLPALRDRSGHEPVLETKRAEALFADFPSPVWFLKTGFLRILHKIRHSPADKMKQFIVAAIPDKAKRQMGSYPDVKTFIENVGRFCEAVVKKCLGCALNGKKVSRPISISVIQPFTVGMVDTFVLDYEKRWYALCVVDLGTGMCWGYVIRDRFPPDAHACYTTYLVRYASVFGPHLQVIADRDSIFSGIEATNLWQELGVDRESTGSFAHFSLGSAERHIGMFRWALDRIRVENPPNSLIGWDVALASIGNQFFNEPDFSGTTPSQRVSGRSTSLLRNALQDTLVTGNLNTNEHIEIAERAREVYTHAKADRRLRKLLNSHLPKGSDQPAYPDGTKVAYYREVPGTRESRWHGPAWIVGGITPTGLYSLVENGRQHYVDRIHVRLWTAVDETPLLPLDPNQPRPAPTEANAEWRASGTHPMDRIPGHPLDPGGVAPDFGQLIHDPIEQKRIEASRPEVTCRRCLGLNQKKSHKWAPGCLKYKPDDQKTWSKKLLRLFEQGKFDPNAPTAGRVQSRGGKENQPPNKPAAENATPAPPAPAAPAPWWAAPPAAALPREAFEAAMNESLRLGDAMAAERELRGTVVGLKAELDQKVTVAKNISQKKRKAMKKLQQMQESLTALDEDYLAILTKSKLENNYEEDLRYIERQLESVYMAQQNADLRNDDAEIDKAGNESKYLYKWEDLSKQKQEIAFKKAISAYDNHRSWFRGSELTEEEFKKKRAEMKRTKNIEVVGLDCTIVRDAKIKNGEVIGKVRIAPRGFRDHTEKAKWFSTSPTVSSVCVRISELLGMMWRLKSWIFDISDAFFSGQVLHEDEYIYIKLPREVIEVDGGDPNRPWRRLRREVPGCKGASSSWFRTLTAKLEKLGFEPMTTDQALFVKREKVKDGSSKVVAILPVHVDDGKLRATKKIADWFFEELRKDKDIALSTVEEQVMGKEVEFTGMTFIERENGEEVHQDVYIKNKLQNVDATGLRNLKPEDYLPNADTKVYGTCIGRLIWLLPTQLKHSYEIAYLSRYRAYPRVKHMRRVATVIKSIKADPQRIFLPRFHPNSPLKLIAIVDAGAGEEADEPLKTRDHQCVATVLAAPTVEGADSMMPGQDVIAGLLSMSSGGVSRVSHASFDFEAISAVSSLDLIVNLRELVGEITNSVCPNRRNVRLRQQWHANLPPCELHSDSMGLVKACRIGLTPSLASRRRRDILDIRDCLNQGDLSMMLHIDGKTNPADVGTKPNARTAESMKTLLRLIHEGRYYAHQSQDHTRTFGAVATEGRRLKETWLTDDFGPWPVLLLE